MAAYSAQPGPGASPGDTLVPRGEALPDSQGEGKGGRRCSPRAPVLPGVRRLPAHPCPIQRHTHRTLAALSHKLRCFKTSPYQENRWQQLGSCDYY